MDLEPHVLLLWCPIKYVAFLILEQSIDPGERHCCGVPQWDESPLGWLTVLLVSLASTEPHLKLVLRLLLGKFNVCLH